MIYDVIILGAGASGLMAGAHLPMQKVLFIDTNPKIAQKVAIAGGGRCNFTNAHMDASHFLGDAHFVKTVLEGFDRRALLAFIKKHAIDYVIEKNDQYFCKTSAQQLISALRLENAHHTFLLSTPVLNAHKVGDFFEVTTSKGIYKARRLIVATGAPSYPKIGASDIGSVLALRLGHEVVPFSTVLVGLTVQKEQFWMRDLSGLSTQVTLSVGEKSFTDALLFAHKGITGPAVLSGSLYWKSGHITIDFLPHTPLESVLNQPQKLLVNQLPFARRLGLALLAAVGLENIPLKKVTKVQWEKLRALKAYHFAPSGTFGLSKAEACRGGVATHTLDAHTMQSRKIEGLYFIGEVVDVTGELGGYNIQWAFSSGVAAARSIRQGLEL